MKKLIFLLIYILLFCSFKKPEIYFSDGDVKYSYDQKNWGEISPTQGIWVYTSENSNLILKANNSYIHLFPKSKMCLSLMSEDNVIIDLQIGKMIVKNFGNNLAICSKNVVFCSELGDFYVDANNHVEKFSGSIKIYSSKDFHKHLEKFLNKKKIPAKELKK